MHPLLTPLEQLACMQYKRLRADLSWMNVRMQKHIQVKREDDLDDASKLWKNVWQLAGIGFSTYEHQLSSYN
jgi:hypothetical protein